MNRLKLVKHIDSLADISDIMNAMKYLSLMESNKLSRYILHQKRAMQIIELAAEDFLHFHPELLEEIEPKAHIIVVLGSERGFCGSYNETLYQSVEEYLNTQKNTDIKIVALGYKLHNKFDQHSTLYSRLHKKLSGPKLVEEIPDIISGLISSISYLMNDQQATQLTVMHHSEDNPYPVFRKILPAFQALHTERVSYRSPPLTHLANTALYYSLLDEYLFASLDQIFYTAFMSENQHRVRHIENSLNKLSEKIMDLSLKRNEVRQEEITEELEVIMLSSSAIENVRET